MSVSVGDQFGSYEIVSSLGAGGMGVVYRARDARLRRDVALKVLPALHASSPDRLARFEREAVALAALKHPNIGAIYGVQDVGGSVALVLELVEGESLAERLARGPLPLDEALTIARQVALALEAAHERGIVHRDIKPGNIQLAPEGAVKVLDFGLAKLVDQSDAPAADPAASPTVTSPAILTGVGVVLGTAPYASPEQVKGHATDRRSDVWAFGCVLYEMLTGARAFPGSDVTDVIAAVLKSDPDWKALPANTPPAVVTLLHRSLRKDRNRRLADMADARIEIDDAVAGPAAAVAPVRPTSRRPLLAAAAAAALAAAVLVSGAAWALRPSPSAVSPTYVRVHPGADVLFGPGPGLLALSPDGRTLAFVGRSDASAPRRIYLRSLDALEARVVDGTDNAANLFFSPDGRWLGFFSEGQVRKVALTGGAPTPIAEAAAFAGATWLADDTIIFQPNGPQGGLKRVSAAGGAITSVTELADGETSHRWPQILPSQQAVLFTAGPAGAGQDAVLVVQPLVGGPRREVYRGGTFGRYLASGHLVFAREQTIFSAPFDLETLSLTADPVPVLNGVAMLAIPGAAQFTVSDTGVMAYLPALAGANTGLPIHWLLRDGGTEPLLTDALFWGTPRFSSDGSRLAVTVGSIAATGGADIWTIDLQRGTRVRVTQDARNDMVPVWTLDSRGLIFASNRGGGAPNLYWQQADGIGQPQRLTTSPLSQFPASLHPSGQWLAAYQGTPPQPQDILFLPIRTENGRVVITEEQPIVVSGDGFRRVFPMFSPDGKWVAFVSNDSGIFEVYVRPFPALDRQVQVSFGGGSDVRWSRTTDELLFVGGTPPSQTTLPVAGQAAGRMMAARYMVIDGAFVPEKTRIWADAEVATNPVGAQVGINVDLHPDGRRFAVAVPVAPTTSARAEEHVLMIFDFFEHVRRRIGSAN